MGDAAIDGSTHSALHFKPTFPIARLDLDPCGTAIPQGELVAARLSPTVFPMKGPVFPYQRLVGAWAPSPRTWHMNDVVVS